MKKLHLLKEIKLRELVDLPKGRKEINVVNKYKARLVLKGYKQEFGTDYKEVFAPVAKHGTIRLMITLVA